MLVALHTLPLDVIPVDFFADPDGRWEYEELAQIAGFDPAGSDRMGGQLSIGALTHPYAGFPEGAAVVMLTTGDRRVIALVDCTAATNVAA